jgi:hypothetical protein
VLLNITRFEITATHIGNKPVSLLIQQFELVTPSQPTLGDPKPVGERDEVHKWLAALVALRNAESSQSGRGSYITSQQSQEFATQIRGQHKDPDFEVLTGPNLSGPVAPARNDGAVVFGSKAEPGMSKLDLISFRARSNVKVQVPRLGIALLPARDGSRNSKVEEPSLPDQATHRSKHPLTTQTHSSPARTPSSRAEKRSVTPRNSTLQSTPKSHEIQQSPVTPSRYAEQSSHRHSRVPSSGSSRQHGVHRLNISLQSSPSARQPGFGSADASASNMVQLSSQSAGDAHALPPEPLLLAGTAPTKVSDDPWTVSFLPTVALRTLTT